MGYRNGIFATIAFALSSAALAGIVYTDDYSRAAQSEAEGFRALTQQLSSSDQLICSDTNTSVSAPVGAALLSANPSATVRQ